MKNKEISTKKKYVLPEIELIEFGSNEELTSDDFIKGGQEVASYLPVGRNLYCCLIYYRYNTD